jgi:hypothetical protein
MARPWLRHPPRTIRPPLVCPSGVQRYATEEHARDGIPVYDTTGLTPHLCSRCAGGWHLIRPTEGDTR